jgi:hypothetical protein
MGQQQVESHPKYRIIPNLAAINLISVELSLRRKTGGNVFDLESITDQA